ncbi:MAG: Rrf2 family transcriptional regulator [Clostridia bacterium]|nr:Rrf2 family transcriptional regulator [Clostridia bacterium]MBQ5812542.1 Rrf2 family transcriptional regulator [Clostridia bacterium]
MRITHEADYAVRIVYVLAAEKKMLPARDISEKSGVTLRFALKILRKLASEGIVVSYKGASGGYELAADTKELSLGQLIECIDGPLEINHCLSDSFDCTRVGDKRICRFRRVFSELSIELRDKLYSLKLSDFID